MKHWTITEIAQMAEEKTPSAFFKHMVKRAGACQLGLLEMARLHPLGDEYLESIGSALKNGALACEGWIYLMTDGGPLYKIGFTKKDLSDRLKSLSRTSVPGRFHLIHAVHVLDAPQAEVLVKQQLKPFSAAKEFYDISWQQGMLALNTARQELHTAVSALQMEELVELLEKSDQTTQEFLQRKSQQKLAC